MAEPLLRLEGVSKRFVKRLDFAGRLAARLGADLREEVVHAVESVDLTVAPGEVLGLVGESGCGKSTLGRVVAGILPASEGRLFYRGEDITRAAGAEAKKAALRIQMVFQDPFASLNPRLKVAQIVGEAPLVHGLVGRAELSDYLDELLTG